MRTLLVALLLAGCATAPAPPIVEERFPGAACDHRVLDLNRRLCAEQGRPFSGPTPERPCGACGAPTSLLNEPTFTSDEARAFERASVGDIVGVARACGCNTCTHDYRKVSATEVEPLGSGQMTLVACPSIGPPVRFR